MDHFGGKGLLVLDIPVDWEESLKSPNQPSAAPVLKVFSERGTFTGPGGSMKKQTRSDRLRASTGNMHLENPPESCALFSSKI